MRLWPLFGFLFAIGCYAGYEKPYDNYLPELRHPGGLNILPNHQYSLDFPVSYTSVCDKTKIRNQGSAGTCTAFAVSSVLTYYAGFPVSALWLFNDNVYKQEGSYFHPGDTELTAISAISRYPVSDAELPYDIDTPYWFLKRGKPDFRPAIVRNYMEIPYDRLDYIKLHLFRDGPLVIEMYITEDIYGLRYGQVVKHLDQTKRAEGFGHALTLCGYTKDYFIVENSWGERWGTDGFLLISYDEWLNRKPNVIRLMKR